MFARRLQLSSEIIFQRAGEISVGMDDGKDWGIWIDFRIAERQRSCKLETFELYLTDSLGDGKWQPEE